jgi:hypothetical protein
MNKSCIIEISGLSGIGKSTTCKNLKLFNSKKIRIVSPIIYSFLKKTYLDRFFIFLTAFKFRTVFFAIYSREVTNNVFSLWIFKFVLLAFFNIKKKHPTSEINVINIILSLNRIRLIYGISRVEGILRGVDFVIDDGYILRAQSVWLRAPKESKNEALKAYLKVIPKRHLCIFIKGEYNEALRRSQVRDKLFRSVFYSATKENPEININNLYFQLSEIFNRIITARKIPVVNVDEFTDYVKQTKDVQHQIEMLKNRQKTAIWVCC